MKDRAAATKSMKGNKSLCLTCLDVKWEAIKNACGGMRRIFDIRNTDFELNVTPQKTVRFEP